MSTKIVRFTSHYKREIFFILVLFLIITASFAAGYLTAKETDRIPIIIEKTER